MSQLNESDFNVFLNNLSQDSEIKEAIINPVILDNNIDKLKKVNETISLPFLICENPDMELPYVKNQLNFLLPASIRKSKEPYVVNIKNDINMYRKLYEKHSKRVNEIIEKTKDSIKNLYPPMKKLRDEIKKYTNDFEGSIKKLDIPYKNKRDVLKHIDPNKFPKDKQKEFQKDKNELIDAINDFLSNINEYYNNYDKLNKKTLIDTEYFVQQFTDLAYPAKELTKFMRTFCKNFENSAKNFNDIKNKKKIDEALQIIKEPITEFCSKLHNMENILKKVIDIKLEEKMENINEITKEFKKIIDTLQSKSNNISKLLNKIIEKYGLIKEELEKMDLSEEPAPVNMTEVKDKIGKEKEEIDKAATDKLKEIEKDAIEIINQSRLDLLFIMDITNSMDNYLDQAKNGILDMIKKIQEQCPGIEINLGFIGYKDFNDLDFGEEYINLEFTTDYEKIKNNIAFVKADGGGDTPEDLCGGLEMGKNKAWAGKSRFAILVTDSPCHGEKYHDLKGEQKDNYPNGDREKRNIEDYILFFAKNDISLYCLKINNTTDKMFKIFKDIYDKNKNKDSKNQFVIQEGKKIFDIVTENAVKIFQNRKNLDIKD